MALGIAEYSKVEVTRRYWSTRQKPNQSVREYALELQHIRREYDALELTEEQEMAYRFLHGLNVEIYGKVLAWANSSADLETCDSVLASAIWAERLLELTERQSDRSKQSNRRRGNRQHHQG
jgi:hypothetical protein